jgi:acyl-lipid omega-6 desaturase (Delta-12 desaturase)
MVEGRDLILATKKYAREDRRKSWLTLLSTTALLLTAYAGAIVNIHIVLQIICGVLAGLLSVRLFIIYHDYLHNTILQNSIFSRLLFTFYGMFILAPTSIWKRSHDYHHANNCKLYTSSVGSFPLVTKKDFLAAGKTDRNIYLFIRHPLTIATGYIFAFCWGMCIRTILRSPRKHFDSLLALFFHYGIGLGIYLLFGLQSLLIGFFLPAVLNSALGSYMFYAQHNFPSAIYKSKEDWNYAFAALYSSSYTKMSRLMHWFTGNIGYHHIHHMNPRIPFYNLPLVWKEMEEFRHPGTTSLSPKDIAACFRIKAWDPEKGKMIGLKEIYAS